MIKTFTIQYEVPQRRAVYVCEVDCETEAEARSAFSAEYPHYKILSVRADS